MPDPAAAPCPICGKSASPEHQPFCSARCAEVDLGRWLTGQYRIPAPADADIAPGDDDDASPA